MGYDFYSISARSRSFGSGVGRCRPATPTPLLQVSRGGANSVGEFLLASASSCLPSFIIHQHVPFLVCYVGHDLERDSQRTALLSILFFLFLYSCSM
jgi:hypothetical protein